MYSKDDVELALLVVREGMSRREAAELAGCGEAAVRNWAAGRLPRSCAPSPRIPGEGGKAGGSAHVPEGRLRPARDGAARRPGAGADGEHPAQGGVGRPKSGRLGAGFDLEQEQVRARRWDTSAPRSSSGPTGPRTIAA